MVKGASGNHLITILATAGGEIFDRQGHPRAFKEAEKRGQEALSFPAQSVLLHTGSTWLLEGTLRTFSYSPTHISMSSNLRLQFFGMFPAEVSVGKQS